MRKYEVCQLLEGVFPATLSEVNTKRKEKNVGCIPDYSGFHFASRWTFWKLTTTNIKMQTGYPWRNELIHEYVRFYLKNIDISKVLSFFVWVKY